MTATMTMRRLFSRTAMTIILADGCQMIIGTSENPISGEEDVW